MERDTQDKTVLNLIDRDSKPKRGKNAAVSQNNAAEASSGAAEAGGIKASLPARKRNSAHLPAPAAPPPPPSPPKKESLSLYEEQERKEKLRAERRKDGPRQFGVALGNALPPITRLKTDLAGVPHSVKPAVEKPVPASTSAPVSIPATASVPEAAQTASSTEAGSGEDERKIIQIKPPIIVKDLAEKMGLKPFKIIKDLMEMEIFATPEKAIEPDQAAAICEKHGFVFEREKREKGGGVHKAEEVVAEPLPPVEQPEDEMRLRPPIVTIMGHVDHGKTSLLDAIRKTRVTTGEAGGITQHIRAYSVKHGDHPITFIDTPGHAAFTKMRARGANVTDVVVLVIAADDGMMPQTIEALNHAKAAKVTIMVAINKIDLPGANPLRIKGQLNEHGLQTVDWGGEVECIEVSATKGIGIDDLLDTIAVQSEVLELKANPAASARASIIESRLEPGRGPTATVIVQNGTLKIGQTFICGPYAGKVRSLVDDLGKAIKQAGPGMPVELGGFDDMPNVGDEVVVMDNEKNARRLSEERLEERRQKKLVVNRRTSLSNLFEDIAEDKKKSLRVILKCDVQGSVEAITGAFGEITSKKINLEVLHAAAGPITDSDVLLASASDAVILGFNTKVESKSVALSKREGVQIKLYSVIYELLDQVKEAMLGLLDPELRQRVTGQAKVKQVFKINRGKVAGCIVTEGKVERKIHARVKRGGIEVYDGKVETLRRFSDDVDEVKNGLECGIRLGDYHEYEEGDIIQFYVIDKIKQGL